MNEQPAAKPRFIETPAAFALVVLIGNAIAWAIPSNVIKLIAREQPVVLGRYSRAHFSWLVFALVVSLIAIFIRCAPSAVSRKRRVFMVIAVCLGLVPAFFIVDLALRLKTEYPYAPDKYVYHRPPNARYDLPYEDVPECKRSLPTTPPGYGRVECVMSYDSEGFRNLQDYETCDIVTLGDSFTEGSRVSDEGPWPVVLARRTELTVRNLGMSGYGSPEYLASLEHYGLPMKPKVVICMLYEGNDFRSARVEPRAGITLNQIVATSPIVVALNDFLCNQLGAIGATRRLSGMEVLSWLPLTVPDGPRARHYAFAAKQLTDLYVTEEKFESELAWDVINMMLKDMKKMCDDAGARLVIAYAPTKAHVLFPVVADRLPPEHVRRYMEYKKRKLKAPEGNEFLPSLLASLDNQESVARKWCQRRDIPFISLTEPLRRDMQSGIQAYFTYDQHWSPDGHAAAAEHIEAALRNEPRVAFIFNGDSAPKTSAMAGQSVTGQ